MPCEACMNFVHTGGTPSKGGGIKTKSLWKGVGTNKFVQGITLLLSRAKLRRPCEAKAKVLPQR